MYTSWCGVPAEVSMMESARSPSPCKMEVASTPPTNPREVGMNAVVRIVGLHCRLVSLFQTYRLVSIVSHLGKGASGGMCLE